MINQVAMLLLNEGHHDEAAPLLKEALGACREQLGDRHEDTLGAINNHAMALEAQGLFDEATTGADVLHF